ncbi:glycerate 2-kinase [Planctomycetaceae bacterium]|nr:glycerate 2-kinase [Planctomycetaceae bacterium]
MRILAAPDKFKQCCTAQEAARAIASGARAGAPNAQVVELPLADGGEGTLDVLARAFPHRVKARVQDPLGREVEAEYALDDSKQAALIESSQACGLWRLEEPERNPLHTTTFGVGQLIAHALSQNVKRIVIGLGGSATSDGGVGMAQALGVKFTNAKGALPTLTGDGLIKIGGIDVSGLDKRLRGVEIRALCDVTTGLIGPQGATRKYVIQKGGTTQSVDKLEMGLALMAEFAKQVNPKADPMDEGSGAAGGLGFGISVFLGGKLEQGSRAVLELLDFQKLLEGTSLVFTGEGSYDEQTPDGKLVCEVARFCGRSRVPCVVLAGSVVPEVEIAGVTAAFEISRFGARKQDALNSGTANLHRFAKHVTRLFASQSPSR